MAGKKFPLDKFPELLKNPPPNLDIMLYDKKKKEPTHSGVKTVGTSRLDRIEERIDRIEESIANLAKIVEDGFKRVDNRIDNLEKDINTRLDYIVKANNLKDSK